MVRNFLVFATVFCFMLTPARANLVGFAEVIVRCDSCPGGLGEDSEGLNGLGMAQASFTDISGRSATLSLSGQESYTETANSLGLDWNLSATFDAVGAELSAGGMLQVDCVHFGCLQFTLNAPSLMHLTLSGITESGELDFFDLGIPAFWVLYGPTLFSSGLQGFGPLDETLFAEPGTYELEGSLGGQIGGLHSQGEGTHLVGSEAFSLSATFTPIPEPRWTIVAVPFGLFWPLVRRHRRVTS